MIFIKKYITKFLSSEILRYLIFDNIYFDYSNYLKLSVKFHDFRDFWQFLQNFVPTKIF